MLTLRFINTCLWFRNFCYWLGPHLFITLGCFRNEYDLVWLARIFSISQFELFWLKNVPCNIPVPGIAYSFNSLILLKAMNKISLYRLSIVSTSTSTIYMNHIGGVMVLMATSEYGRLWVRAPVMSNQRR